MKISEKMLHFIWKYGLFHKTNIQTISGKKVTIKKVGHHNFNEGPDFENAFILVDGIEWVGNVEIHVCSSEWNHHKHQYNPGYNTVILHVVNLYDIEVKRHDGTIPETLVIGPLIDTATLNKYRFLSESIYKIPCEKLIHTVDPFHIQPLLNRVLFERLISKSDSVFDILEERKGNWEEVSYILFARNFGFGVNSDAFEQLAKSLPLNLIRKYQHNKQAVEALIFGQAGMLLNEFDEAYPRQLQLEYNYLRKLHNLNPISVVNWKFLRMRPMNFPTMRLAQFCAFCVSIDHFFSSIIESENLDLWKLRFAELKVNDYWSTHYHFQKESAKHRTQLGKVASNLIVINTIVVLLFSYGKYVGDNIYINRSVSFLEDIEPESNRIVRQYKELGFEIESAADTQAIKQLKTFYCDKKYCLHCEVGYQILKPS